MECDRDLTEEQELLMVETYNKFYESLCNESMYLRKDLVYVLDPSLISYAHIQSCLCFIAMHMMNGVASGVDINDMYLQIHQRLVQEIDVLQKSK